MLNSVVSLGSALSGTSKHVLLHNGPDKEALYPFRVIVLPGCLRTRPSHEFSLISPNGRCSKTATRFTVIGYSSSVRIFFGISEWTNRWHIHIYTPVHIFVHLIFIWFFFTGICHQSTMSCLPWMFVVLSVFKVTQSRKYIDIHNEYRTSKCITFTLYA